MIPFKRVIYIVLALSFGSSLAFAADTQPRTKLVPALGIGEDLIVDTTSIGTVTGSEVSLTGLLNCSVIQTDASGNLECNDALASSSGDITAVTAGTNLSGGGTTGAVTLNVDDAFLVNDADDETTGSVTMVNLIASGTVSGLEASASSGKTTFNGVTLTWPTTAGSDSQRLTTNGSGQLSWETVSSGIANVVEDTTPQLGGDLDAQGNNITDLADVTFQTGVTGGTLRTGTSAADKFVLQAYDVDGGAYLTMIEVDAGNTPLMDLAHVTDILMDNAGEIRTGTTAADTYLLRAYDVDGAAYTTFATLTANNTPTMSLEAAVTGATASADDNDTSLATTAFVQQEINGAGGTNLSCSSGQCNVDAVFLPLAGGTMTAEFTADDLGIEFAAGDTLTDCTTFAATGGGIFYDDSEGKFKKCQDNTLTDLDTGGSETNALETTITGIQDAEVLVGTGADSAAYIAGLAACAADEKIEYVPGSPDTFTCEAIGSLVEADITDLAHTATDITADIVDFNDIKFDNTLAGNPALLVDECFFVSTATGGGFICEGSTADTQEQLYVFPDANGADTTEYIVISDDANVSATEAGFLDGVTAAIADTDDTLAVFAATTSAQLRGVLSDESGTGAAIFAGGDVGAATATTPAADDSDTSVATTAYVQGEINGAGGTNLSCSSGQCNVDAVFLPLAGGTMTAEFTADDLGIEFTAGDTLTDCSTFAATGGGIFYDDSEGKFKKCEDNVLSDLDNDSGGSTAFDDIGDPDNNAESEVIFDNASETATFSYTGAFGDVDAFLIQSETGNPTDGVLLTVIAHDTDVEAAELGDNTNYTQFTSNGEIHFAGTAAPYTTIILTAGAATPLGQSAPAFSTISGNSNLQILKYDNAATESAFWQIMVPENLTGTTCEANIYWTADNGGAAETVEWEISTCGVTDAENWDTECDPDGASILTITDTWIANDDLHVTSQGTLTHGWAGGDMGIIQITRDHDGTDDLGDEAEFFKAVIRCDISQLSYQ